MPQAAPAPNSAMNARPMMRSVTVFLLQPWSTAITQTTNRKMAIPPMIFSSMTPSDHHVADKLRPMQ
jgi:hypothetical protein